MLDIYVEIFGETPEVMILDRNVIRARLHLRRNCECDCPLIVFINCDYIFKNTTKYCQGVSLKLECKLNFLKKTQKR